MAKIIELRRVTIEANHSPSLADSPLVSPPLAVRLIPWWCKSSEISCTTKRDSITQQIISIWAATKRFSDWLWGITRAMKKKQSVHMPPPTKNTLTLFPVSTVTYGYTNAVLTSGGLWRARSRLFRHRCLQLQNRFFLAGGSTRCTSFLHNSRLKISAKVRHTRWRLMSAKCV